MPIAEFSHSRVRRRVAVFGEQPSSNDLDAFSRRGFEVKNATDHNLSDQTWIGATDSVILSQKTDQPWDIFHVLKRHGQRLLDADCRIYIRVATSSDLRERGRVLVVKALAQLQLPPANLAPVERALFGEWYTEREGITLAPYAFICDVTVTWEEIAQLIVENAAGKPANLSLEVHASTADGHEFRLPLPQQILLQRAFSDCSVVHLKGMDDGLSGVSAFRAYAEPTSGLHGPWPYLYFVKIGRRAKVAREYLNYQGSAMLYVPFNLGPRLNQERCALGAHEGIIVADYVEGAESIRDSARGGRAHTALATIFNRTLRGWHSTAQRRSDRPIPEMLAELFPDRIPADRIELISSFGATRKLDELRAAFASCTSLPIYVGPIHGDLHATNVLVRGGDGIIIDFERFMAEAPILYDFASLEGGLLVDGFRDDPRSDLDWYYSIESLYRREALLQGITPCHPNDASSWFFDSVMQIRMHARQFECTPGQYASCLALTLLRKSCNEFAFPHEKLRLRAGAYALGEQILQVLQSDSSLWSKR